MAKLSLTDLANLSNEATVVAAINANNTSTETALEKTLSRDGTSPNQMEASLDMNSNRIINLPEPATGSEPLRLSDANTLIAGGTISTNPSGGGTGDILAKASATDYDTEWVTQNSLAVSTATQTALDAKISSSVLTTRGDILYRDATVPARLAKGAASTLLTMGADDPAWATLSALLDAAIGSTRGMLLLRGSSSWGALAIGSASQVLTSDGTDPAWAAASGGTPGQIPGTSTNDNATAGNVGEYLSTSTTATASAATVTMTIAAPAVVTWTSHGFTVGPVTTAIRFSTTGALPTGVTSGTTYYLKAIDANTFNIATSAANALAGTFITTTGSQSGTHTGDDRASMTSTVSQDFAAISLEAGDWDVTGFGFFACGQNTTTIINYNISLSGTSATPTRVMGRFASQQFSVAGTALGLAEYNVFPIPTFRVSIASTTTLYLVGNSTFGASTLNAGGWMSARRVR